MNLATWVCCIFLTGIACAQTFTTIDFPGAINTQPTGITSSGIIVGSYTSVDGNKHGFVLAAGKFVSIDVPNGSQTSVNSINSSGDMVGEYADVGGRTHGYLLSGGKFTTIDYPAAGGTQAFGISASGDIVGIFVGPAPPRGFLLTKYGDFSSIDYPGAEATFATMTNGKTIVGVYLRTQKAHSYRLTGGNYQTVTCAGWDPVLVVGITPLLVFRSTLQVEMTGSGTLLADGRQHGLVVSGSKCTAIDFPGSMGGNVVNSINPAGDMVGTYQTPDLNGHGYLRTNN